jgi:TetR/AcrR family transcriptional repressor of nem operon
MGIMTKGEETRQFIIEQSAPIFNVKGIAATAMSDVMEATKLSKGSLYVHFENKEVLAAAVVEHNMDQLGKKIFGALNKEKTAKAKLIAYINLLSDALNPPVKGGCPIMNFGMEADDTNQTLRKSINIRIEDVVKTITEIIKAGSKNGEFKPGWHAREFATLMFASIEGGIMMSRVAGQNASMVSIARQLEKIIDEHTK